MKDLWPFTARQTDDAALVIAAILLWSAMIYTLR